MPRTRQPEILASEFWMVDSVETSIRGGTATLVDTFWWKCQDPADENEDCPDVIPGTKGADHFEYSEHRITVPVKSATGLRPGDYVRITVEHVA